MNQFLTAMVPYRDRFGFPAGILSPHDPSGNCLMFLGEEMLILVDQELFTIDDQQRFTRLLSACTIESGNYRRTPAGCPFSNDQEQWDDFIGIAAGSFYMRTFHANAVLHYGSNSYFRWGPFRFRFAYPLLPNLSRETTDVKAWLGRNPSFVAHLHWAARETPALWLRLVWCWAVAFAGWKDPGTQDPWRLSYLLVRTAPTGGWWRPEYWASKIWSWRLYKNWPGGIPAVRRMYFADPNHPLAVWMKENAHG